MFGDTSSSGQVQWDGVVNFELKFPICKWEPYEVWKRSSWLNLDFQVWLCCSCWQNYFSFSTADWTERFREFKNEIPIVQAFYSHPNGSSRLHVGSENDSGLI